MATASLPLGLRNVSSSAKPVCFRSRGRMSFSIVRVNSAPAVPALPLRCIDTSRAYMSPPWVVILLNNQQFTRLQDMVLYCTCQVKQEAWQIGNENLTSRCQATDPAKERPRECVVGDQASAGGIRAGAASPRPSGPSDRV